MGATPLPRAMGAVTTDLAEITTALRSAPSTALN